MGKENGTMPTTPKSSPLVPKPLSFRKRALRYFPEPSVPLATLNSNISVAGDRENKVISPAKRINPFRCSEPPDRKRKRREEEHPVIFSEEKEFVTFREQDITSSIPRNDPVTPNIEKFHGELLESIPVDWSLKMKIRVTSEKPFPWRANFKMSEEASGTSGFVRCLHAEDTTTCNLDSSYGAKFFQNCLVWLYPSIPWLKMFPRTSSVSSVGSSLSPAYVQLLHSNWCDSLRSLYHLVRTCQCPYFYVCAPNFTVMFRSGGVESVTDIHCAITPTTKNLRNKLADEDIDFSMPFMEQDESEENDEKSPISDSCMDESASRTHHDASDDNATHGGLSDEEEEGETKLWLESLGLSRETLSSLNRTSQKQTNTRFKDVESSLVFVEGEKNIQLLVNFLLNYPFCNNGTGDMAGIPPTLLSPVAFLGATLQQHKVRLAKAQMKDKGLYVLELHGPILPNVIHSLYALFNSTQDGNFCATLTSHRPTLPFARLPYRSDFPSVFATENLKDCGMPAMFIKKMCAKQNSGSNKPISSITAKNSLFTWPKL